MRYLGRLLWLLFTIIVVVIAMIFATSNNDMLTIYMWPFTQSVTAPVWLFILGGCGAGAVFGGIMVWASFIAIRTRNWRLQKKLTKAEKQLAEATAKPINAPIHQTGASPAGALIERPDAP